MFYSFNTFLEVFGNPCDDDPYGVDFVWERVNFYLYCVVFIQLGVSQPQLAPFAVHNFRYYLFRVQSGQPEDHEIDL